MRAAAIFASFLICLASMATDSVRPFAKAQPIALSEAHWTSGFWFDRFELCRTNMLPNMGRLMEGTNYSQFLRNFEIAAGLADALDGAMPVSLAFFSVTSGR